MSIFLNKVLVWSAFVCIVQPILCERALDRGPEGQSSSNPTETMHLAFDVASIRENLRPDMRDIFNDSNSSMFEAHGVTPYTLIMAAYGIKVPEQLRTVPNWAQNTTYNITAKSDEATDRLLAKMQQEDAYAEKRHMLQVMLAERFHLRIHQVIEQSTVYDLVTTPRAATLMAKVSGDGHTVGTCAHHFDRTKGFLVDSKGCPFTNLFSSILQATGTDVVDHTGLSGMYAYRLMYKPRNMPEREGLELYPDIVDAVREQLGLELRKRRGPITVWVVDSIERPTAN